jgi:rubrerythrin
MANEREKTYEVLQTAIRMEIDGKEFYQKASRSSGNELGKKLLAKLAEEEDVHIKVFERIFNNIRENKGWPKSKIQIDTGKSVKTVFAVAMKQMDRDVKPASTELDDIQTAMAMENKTYDYYTSHGREAVLPAEKEFYSDLASQEQGHHRSLLEYFEFLKNPAAYFVQKEHLSVDGG